MTWIGIGAAILWLIGTWMIGRNRGGTSSSGYGADLLGTLNTPASAMKVENLPTVAVGNVVSTADGQIQIAEVGYHYLPGNSHKQGQHADF